jgi:hypothetical protein
MLFWNFTPYFVKDRHTKQPLLRAPQTNGLYHLSSSPQASIGERVSTSIWHKRLRHASPSTNFIINSNFLPITSNKLDLCGACCKAKAHVLPFTSSLSIATSPLHVVHSDLWGPSLIVSMNGFRCYVHFVDEFSKFSWIYFLHTKYELVDVFAKFKSQVENLFSTTIKILQTDVYKRNTSHLLVFFLKLFTKSHVYIPLNKMELSSENIVMLLNLALPLFHNPLYP